MNQSSFLTRRSLSAIAGLVGAAVVLHGAPAHAQQSEIDLLRQQLVELQARLEKLEANKVDTKATTPFITSSSKLPVVVSGLLQVRGNNFFGDDRPSAPGISDTFLLRRGEIRLTAPQITDKISGTAMFDVAKVGIANNSLLQELQISYLINKTANNTNTLDLGQFKIPFGFEGDLVSSGALQTVDRALFYRNSDPSGGRAGDIRDVGARLRGSLGQFAYDIGVFNGLGERQNQTATGDPKAVVGRLIFRPTGLPGFQLGVSGARGNQRSTPIGTPAVNSRVERDLINAFAVYRRDKISAQAEYFEGDFLNATAGTRRDRSSYYGSLGYLFTPKLEGVVRYDSFDADRNAGNTTTKESTLGLNYYIKGNNAKLQTNVVKVDANAADRTELRTQVQVAF